MTEGVAGEGGGSTSTATENSNSISGEEVIDFISQAIDLVNKANQGADEASQYINQAGDLVQEAGNMLGGDVSLLVLRRAAGESAVDGHGADWNAVALAADDRADHLLDELGSFRGHRRGHGDRAGDRVRHFDFMQVIESGVDGGKVLLNHGLAALAVCLLDRLLALGDRFLTREDAADGEEAGLHDRVDADPHAGLLAHLVAVDHVELELFLDDLFLNFLGQVIPHLVSFVRAVEEEGGAGHSRLQHIELLEERELVTGDEVGFVHQIS